MVFSLISVIIPTYNRAQTILRAVNSVLNQTYREIECIIIDDASSDDTPSLIAKLEDERIIYVKHERNKNASASRNTGLLIAKGDLIAFHDSDDEWLPEKLEKQVKLLKSLPERYGMVYCWMDYYIGEKIVFQLHKENRGMIFPDVLTHTMTGGTPTLLLRKEVISEIGGFDELMLNGDDQDFIRRVAHKYLVDYVPEVLTKVYVNHSSEPRLSDPGIKKNNLDVIRSLNMTLLKFKSTFRNRPDLKASVYSSIAYHYAILGEKKNFFKYNNKAWFIWPFRGRIKSTLRGIMILNGNKIN